MMGAASNFLLSTLFQLVDPAKVAETTPAAPKNIGRTPWDLLAESVGPGFLLLAGILVVVLVVGVVVLLIFTIVVYRRAARENREFTLIPPRVGLKHIDPSAAAPTGASGSAGEDALKAALEIAYASDHEVGYLLYAVANQATNAGKRRRASVMFVDRDEEGRLFMAVDEGFPEGLFQKPRTKFSQEDYRRHQKGMCWAAVDGCSRSSSQADALAITRYVMVVPDVKAEPSYRDIVGRNTFRSILIAPIQCVGSNGIVEVFGVVCLDSETPNHYSDKDAYLLALAAVRLSSQAKALKRLSVSL